MSLLAFATAACDQAETKPVTVTRERSQAIAATPGAPPPTTDAPSAEPKPASAAPRQLCGGKLGAPGKVLPSLGMSKAAATGERQPPDLQKNPRGYTWINFWAAWCKPCKEEIPLLKSWAERLGTSDRPLSVVFVSLDDDPRQLQGFLEAEPQDGLRQTYWLREGKEREDWFGALSLSADPELPMHLLVDSAGKVRCVVNGAVEASDYAQLVALLKT